MKASLPINLHSSSFVFSRKGHVPPCYQSQLIIIVVFHEEGTSLCYSQLIIICVYEGARPSPFVQSHILICCNVTRRGITVLLRINHISSPLCYEGHVPPCYQSQLIIMLVFTKGTSLPCYLICSSFSREARPSVLSITTHHQLWFHIECTSSINHTHHHVVLQKHVPPYHHISSVHVLC
jgi:hypothetical protein